MTDVNHEKNVRSKHVPKWQISPFCNTATVHQGECHLCGPYFTQLQAPNRLYRSSAIRRSVTYVNGRDNGYLPNQSPQTLVRITQMHLSD